MGHFMLPINVFFVDDSPEKALELNEYEHDCQGAHTSWFYK